MADELFTGLDARVRFGKALAGCAVDCYVDAAGTEWVPLSQALDAAARRIRELTEEVERQKVEADRIRARIRRELLAFVEAEQRDELVQDQGTDAERFSEDGWKIIEARELLAFMDRVVPEEG